MALETELETYKAKLPELKQHIGKYVLIHGERVVGIFVSREDALRQGNHEFGTESFLVKRVQGVPWYDRLGPFRGWPEEPDEPMTVRKKPMRDHIALAERILAKGIYHRAELRAWHDTLRRLRMDL